MLDLTKLGPCLLLVLLMGGCTSTRQANFGGTADSKMIAVVGDRPLPSTVGEPGGQVSASEIEPEPRRDPVARISGRVVDEKGRAIPEATVRLADGGIKGGRDIQATTDASGAFTLSGLRAGSKYTLLAEFDDGRDVLVGRTSARTSESGVEISLMAKDDGSTPTHSAARPARVNRVSSVEDEPATEDNRPRINREDVSSPDEDPGPANPGKPRLNAPVPAVGWRNANAGVTREARNPDDEVLPAATTAQARRPRRTPQPKPPVEDEDGGVNPLPPAIEPEADDATSAKSQPRSKVSRKTAPVRDEPEELAVAPRTRSGPEARQAAPLPMPGLSNDELTMANPLPEALPADPIANLLAGPPPARPTEAAVPPGVSDPPGAGGPPPASTTDLVPNLPASQPVFASPGPTNKPEPDAPYNPFALVAANDPSPAPEPEPTPASVPQPQPKALAPEPVPAAEAPAPAAVARKTWGDLSAVEQAKPPATKPTKATSFLARFKPPGAADAKKDVAIASVLYDPKTRRLTDFILPDLQGNPVRFQDFDADYILLDFWGTQYKTCLDSIPRLVQLQKQYGPSRLKVVGIACEKGLSNARKTQVDEFSRKLGINYAVLLSDMNATCPVRQALDVRYFPTMILLDRQGQVVWHGEGATPLNFSKLDTVLAKNLKATSARR